MTTLEQRVSALEAQMQDIQSTLQQVAQLQLQGQQQLNRLEQTQQRTQEQLESFIREWSRINANQAEMISRHDAATESNRESIRRITNTLENTNQRLGDLIEYLRGQ